MPLEFLHVLKNEFLLRAVLLKPDIHLIRIQCGEVLASEHLLIDDLGVLSEFLQDLSDFVILAFLAKLNTVF